MIKIKKGNTLIFGLTEENISRLKQDMPIKFNLNEMGLLDQDVFIIYGKDEQTFRDMFQKHIDPTKAAVQDYKSKDN